MPYDEEHLLRPPLPLLTLQPVNAGKWGVTCTKPVRITSPTRLAELVDAFIQLFRADETTYQFQRSRANDLNTATTWETSSWCWTPHKRHWLDAKEYLWRVVHPFPILDRANRPQTTIPLFDHAKQKTSNQRFIKSFCNMIYWLHSLDHAFFGNVIGSRWFQPDSKSFPYFMEAGYDYGNHDFKSEERPATEAAYRWSFEKMNYVKPETIRGRPVFESCDETGTGRRGNSRSPVGRQQSHSPQPRQTSRSRSLSPSNNASPFKTEDRSFTTQPPKGSQNLLQPPTMSSPSSSFSSVPAEDLGKFKNWKDMEKALTSSSSSSSIKPVQKNGMVKSPDGSSKVLVTDSQRQSRNAGTDIATFFGGKAKPASSSSPSPAPKAAPANADQPDLISEDEDSEQQKTPTPPRRIPKIPKEKEQEHRRRNATIAQSPPTSSSSQEQQKPDSPQQTISDPESILSVASSKRGRTARSPNGSDTSAGSSVSGRNNKKVKKKKGGGDQQQGMVIQGWQSTPEERLKRVNEELLAESEKLKYAMRRIKLVARQVRVDPGNEGKLEKLLRLIDKAEV